MTTTTAEVTRQSTEATMRAEVIAGVDTHKDSHHVAVLSAATGAKLGDPRTATKGCWISLAPSGLFG